MRAALAVAAAVLLPLAAGAESRQPLDRLEFEAGASGEHLTNGFAPWRSAYLLGDWRLAGGGALFGGWRETERYGLRDGELRLGGVLPLAARVQLEGEAAASASHRVLARAQAALGLRLQWGEGWGAGGGWRRSDFDAGLTSVAHAGIERYLGNERFAYTVYAGGPDGAGTAASHAWQWSHYYGERDSVGLTLSHGRETEYAASAGFVTTPVRGVVLGGRHHLDPRWALSWEAGSVRQGDYYTRSGIRLGLRHAF